MGYSGSGVDLSQLCALILWSLVAFSGYAGKGRAAYPGADHVFSVAFVFAGRPVLGALVGAATRATFIRSRSPFFAQEALSFPYEQALRSSGN